ncbi:Conserved_hypothetical protein [Hexamita inflata]|uniref:Uncharacterized protein n=1 Tax=Hexamita inflata TaxID=28002 RepID=A0ABP1HR15_9EUKA
MLYIIEKETVTHSFSIPEHNNNTILFKFNEQLYLHNGITIFYLSKSNLKYQATLPGVCIQHKDSIFIINRREYLVSVLNADFTLTNLKHSLDKGNFNSSQQEFRNLSDKWVQFLDEQVPNNQLQNLSSKIIPYFTNIFKPLPQYDIFVSLEDNNLTVFDSEYRILSQTQINFDFRTGYCSPKYNRSRVCTFDSFNYVPVICNSTVYVQGFDYLYKLQGTNLIQVTKIPNMNLSETRDPDCFYGCLFSIDNELYCHSNCSFYKLVNNTFKLVKFSNMDGQIFQSHTSLYFHSESKLYKVTDFSFSFVTSAPKLKRVGSVLLCFSSDYKQVTVIEMETGMKKTVQNASFDQNLSGAIELGANGIQIKDQIIQNIFSTRFEPIPHERIDGIVNYEILHKFRENQILERTNKLEKTIQDKERQIILQQRTIQTKLSHVISKQKISASTLAILCQEAWQ